MSKEPVLANGVNADHGDYLLPPLTPEQISRVAQGQSSDAERAEQLEEWDRRTNLEHLGPQEGINAKDLAEAGWGVVFARDSDPAVREALGKLLDHRRQQSAQRCARYYRELSGAHGYQPGETDWDFLDRNEAGFGPADPENLPYYLLLVGSPEEIPFSFQYKLDVEYAVGRLFFDTPEEYAAYARAVVESETGTTVAAPRAAFFAVRNPGDVATEQSHDILVEPLAEIMENAVDRQQAAWQVETHLEGEATKNRLEELLGGDRTPNLLFSASHGVAFDNGSPRQLPHQGAVLCQDWPGREVWGKEPIPEEHYFSGDDIRSTAQLSGLIAFHFGCYGAGTTRLDAFSAGRGGTPQPIAPYNFIAGLPQRLLEGGALAFVSHVERAWAYSYLGLHGGERLQTFKSTLKRLMEGHPVGSAMEYFNRRYATMSVSLSRALQSTKLHGKIVDDHQLSRLWTACNDARSYVTIGDPAVRLPLATA